MQCNKSNVLVQAWHICWSMSVKSSFVKCLSNAVVKVSCNCWERILILKEMWSSTFEKQNTMTAKEVVLIQLFSYSVVSKQKIKMKTWNTMAPSYHSKVTSTQNKGVPFFSCLGHGSIISSCLDKVKVFPIILTW